MKYLCLAYGDRKKMGALTKADFDALKGKCAEYDAELRASGHFVSAESLEWDAVTIRPRGGKPVTTDGPFAETKEQIGGVIIIEAKDLNEAVRIASMHPAAHLGETLGWGVEVRPYSAGCHQ
jgi:hypothetical protein